MKRIGNSLATLLGLCLLIPGVALAALEASVDRDRVALGDTLQLTLKATGPENLSALDLNPLLADFQVLQQSTRSNTRILNGRRESSRELLLQIAPRRAGTLRIPPLPLGNDRTNMILVSVGPAPDTPTAGGDVFFEAELDRTATWVQGQVILTLRLHQSVNLESRSITDLKVDNAYVHTLEQNSFQRQVQGRPSLVTEIRYAIFPEQSGTLTIPAQTFTAREAGARRSMFDSNNGRLLSRTTDALEVQVKSRPDNYPGSATWLPAQEVTISESWSTSPEQLQVGESATRRITVIGKGLQGAQLPPIAPPALNGVKVYPDQPIIEDTESADGLTGNRTDSAAFIPTTPGNYILPALRLPWWDSRRNELRWAMLPERRIRVTGAAPSTPPVVPLSPQAENATGANIGEAVTIPAQSSTWKWIAIISGAGWSLTLFYLFLRRSPKRDRLDERLVAGDNNERQLWRQLQKQCKTRDPHGLRQTLPRWASSVLDSPQISGLHSALAALGSADLSDMLCKLDRELYGSDVPGNTDWEALASCLQALRNKLKQGNRDTDGELSLYPVA